VFVVAHDESGGTRMIINGSVKPADFPVGSAQSRAAARVMLEKRSSSDKRSLWILSSPIHRCPTVKPGEWYSSTPGEQSRTICVPVGMKLSEALPKAGGLSEDEIKYISRRKPEPLGVAAVILFEW